MPFLRLAFVGLLSLCLAVSVWAQNEAEKVPSLQDARTLFDISDYMHYESGKISKDTESKQRALLLSDIYMNASDKMLEIAKDENDIHNAYTLKFWALHELIIAEAEDALQKMEAFLEELASKGETRYKAEELRFQLFIREAMKTINTPEGNSAFKAGLKAWIYRNIDSYHIIIRVDRIATGVRMVAIRCGDLSEQFFTDVIEELILFIESEECTLSAEDKTTAVRQFKQELELQQFGLFFRNALETVNSSETFDAFKVELKEWINRKTVNVFEIPKLGLLLAEKCGISAEQFINELIEYVQSPECTSPYRQQFETEWKKMLLTAFGSELKLYGRTLADEDFDWASLRDKYVLVQFTATWCGPCHMEIPGMRKPTRSGTTRDSRSFRFIFLNAGRMPSRRSRNMLHTNNCRGSSFRRH